MRRYRVSGELRVLGYQPGEEFDHEYDEAEESALLAVGRIEIVPLAYRVIGNHAVCGVEPGKNLEAGLPLAQEASLIAGGHIERHQPKPSKKKE